MTTRERVTVGAILKKYKIPHRRPTDPRFHDMTYINLRAQPSQRYNMHSVKYALYK